MLLRFRQRERREDERQDRRTAGTGRAHGARIFAPPGEGVTGQPDPIGIAMSLLSGSIGTLHPLLSADRPPRLGETMLVAIRMALVKMDG